MALVNPEPWRIGDGYKWFGELNSALAMERGNTDTDELDINFESIWRSLEDRYTVRGAWELDEANGVEKQGRGSSCAASTTASASATRTTMGSSWPWSRTSLPI